MFRDTRPFYTVQAGDSLHSISNRFLVPVSDLIRFNGLTSPLLMIGQIIDISDPSTRQPPQQYRPVTAYTATRPIIVNGVDINQGLYPVLNYKPENAQYPYIYVPIAEFSRVGAKVMWDDPRQIMVVETDYYQLKAENEQLRARLAAYEPAALRGNTSGNITNWGIAAQQGDWTYFSNITDNYKLYKMRTDGSSKSKLSDDNVLYINVAGDWIYYCNRSDQSKIYKISTDGTGRARIDDEHSASLMMVDGEWIYYITPNEQFRMYKIKTDGTGKSRIGDDYGVNNLYAADGWIYYTAESVGNKLHRIKTDGTQKMKLFDESAAQQLNVVGRWIYFVRTVGGGVYRINNDGTGVISFDTEYANPSSLNVDGDWIYYGYSKLYKRRTDAPENIELPTVPFGFSGLINIANGWIYFRIQYNGEKLYRMRTDGTQGEIVY